MPDDVTNNVQQTNDDGKGAGSQQTSQAGDQAGGDDVPLKWDSWYQGLDDSTKDMVDDHISGLKNALDGERAERKKLAGQIRDLSGKAEKGSEMQQQLDELSGSLEQANLRADFFEHAVTSEVSNVRLAMVAARDAGLFEEYLDKRSGKVDFERVFEALKTDYPELFRPAKQQTTNAHAGAGTNNTSTQTKTMNDLIRERAGIRS